MNTDETFEFENRTYVNPDISRDEQMAFVDTLRDIQAQNNAQIETQTHNLGTDVEPHLGGLSGSEEYWKSKYQTPQTAAAVANMKAVAQQSALNNALENYQNSLQERYNQAYRAYQKRAYNYNRKNSGGDGGDGDNKSGWDGEFDEGSGHYVYWLGQDGNVWVTKDGQTSNLGTANMVNGQWDGKASGSAGKMSGDGTKIDDPNPGGGSSSTTTMNFYDFLE